MYECPYVCMRVYMHFECVYLSVNESLYTLRTKQSDTRDDTHCHAPVVLKTDKVIHIDYIISAGVSIT